MSNLVEIKVPDIGDFSEVEVIEVLVSEGDTIAKEQSLITVESDKASMEIPASSAGVVKSVKVKVGDKIKQGSVILALQAQESPNESATQEKASQKPAATSNNIATASVPAKATDTPVSAAVSAAVSQSTATVVVPDIGDVNEVAVIELLVAVGDTVQLDQSLITVESEKASMEIPSSQTGVVTAIKVKVGDKVSEGSEILQLTVSGTATAAEPVAQQEPAVATLDAATSAAASGDQPQAAEVSTAVASEVSVAASTTGSHSSPTLSFADDVPPRNLPHASPSVRKFARELGVDLTQVSGSAPKGRITADDVRSFVKQAVAGRGVSTSVQAGGLAVLDWPKIDFSKFGPTEAKPLSRIKKLSGANLHRNWVMIPHVTNNDAADITDLEALRVSLNNENKNTGVKVTMLAFLIKAAVAGLKKFPEFNASLDGDNLVYKQYYNIGFAADTPNGLVVPVIRDADKKGIFELAAETAELAKQARDGKLSPAQMQGGCFSISSLGGIGGTSFTPIINAPEVAILGVSRSAMTPVWDGAAFQPRLMLPLSLSYDHRVIDGALAARFNVYLTSLLADFRRIAL